MEQLTAQLGIDWHLLLSQVVNFGLLFVVLRLFVYRPLLDLLHRREHTIEEGITKAAEADRRLHEVDLVGKEKVKAAEVEALGILKRTEGEAKELEAKMLADAKRKEAEEMAGIAAKLKLKEEESRRAMNAEAAAMVKKVIARTVELAPEKIDESLIARAIKESSL